MPLEAVLRSESAIGTSGIRAELVSVCIKNQVIQEFEKVCKMRELGKRAECP
jgi:hypothetical protein